MSSQPTRPFQDPREVLTAHLASVAAGVASQLKETALTYRVSGGPPGKRLSTELRVSGMGDVTYQQSDELRGQRAIRAKTTLPTEEVRALFRQVRESSLLEHQDTGAGFLPDSVIGSISIESRDARITYYFLAEEHQQQSQGKEPPPSIRRLKPLLDALCERVRRAARTKKAD
jgi:hypothetical protein